MNDPGLDNPIDGEAEVVEHEIEEGDPETAEADYLVPSRWWFASTAFPLIAGTFGPMASAFSVCALVENWRVQVPPGGTEGHGIKVADTPWLIAINAVSLVLALIANMSLLLNMARRIPFAVAQPITIIGWYIASALLIALVAAVPPKLPLPAGEDRALTQAFYYAIIAAALYFFVASIMIVTAFGAYTGRSSKEFILTMSQRTLMLQTISFLVYLLSGSAVYAKIEDWNFLDAVYFADFTLLTIGIGGDLTPKTHLGRGLLFPYAVGGIVIIGLVIGSVRSLVLERAKKKLGARMVEKHRKKALDRMDKKDLQKLLPVSKEEETSDSTKLAQREMERRRAEFELMREIQSSAMRRRRWTSLGLSASAWMVLWVVGAAVFQQAERNQGWSYFESMYFAYTSLLTIGYGDFLLMSDSGKPFFVFWSLCAVPALTILISNMGDTIVKFVRDVTLWVGNVTVLPGESRVVDALKEGAGKAVHRKSNNFPDPQGGDSEGFESFQEKRLKTLSLSSLTPEKDHSTLLRENREYAHYVIAKEICNVLERLTGCPEKEYTYDEWAWYLELIGEDETSTATHRAATEKTRDIEKQGQNRQAHDPEAANVDQSGADGLQAAATSKDSAGRKQWSWLEHRSPLMGDQKEAEWLLNRLSLKLEQELGELYKNRKEA